MGREKWSRQKIIEKLIELYYDGKSLNRKDIPSNLYAVIHRKNKETKEGEYFDSIFETREAVALELEYRDAFEDAEKVRQYNHVVHSGNNLTEEDIKKNLIKILEKKIKQKEDVSYIAQKNKNSVFVHRCKKRFGSYEALFTEAGLDYYKFVKQDMRPKEVFLDQLINDFILKNKDLDRVSVEEEDSDLVKHLKARYGRYYQGLQAALDRAFEKELIEESERTNVDFWRQKRTKEWNEKQKKQAKIKQKTRENILVINKVVNHKSHIDEKFISKSKEQNTLLGIKLFNSAVEQYSKRNSEIFEYDPNLNFKYLQIGDVIVCNNQLKSILNKINNKLHVLNEKGVKEQLEFNNKTKAKPEKTRNINDFL